MIDRGSTPRFPRQAQVSVLMRREKIPTSEQKTQCYILCCWFTKLYLPINIVRLDERTGNIFLGTGQKLKRNTEKGFHKK